MASMGSPTSSRKPRRRASSSSKPTRSPAATSSARRSKLLRAGIRDVIAPGLKVLFVGINPGLMSVATGHHFARPGNRFWPTLHRAGFTATRLHPSRQEELLHRGYGITNLVNRGTAAAAELSPGEFVQGRQRLAQKVRRYSPRIVAFLGVGAYRHAFGLRDVSIGRQPGAFEGAAVWVLPNPSGLNANYQMPALVQLFRRLWRQSSTSPSSARSTSGGGQKSRPACRWSIATTLHCTNRVRRVGRGEARD